MEINEQGGVWAPPKYSATFFHSYFSFFLFSPYQSLNVACVFTSAAIIPFDGRLVVVSGTISSGFEPARCISTGTVSAFTCNVALWLLFPFWEIYSFVQINQTRYNVFIKLLRQRFHLWFWTYFEYEKYTVHKETWPWWCHYPGFWSCVSWSLRLCTVWVTSAVWG